MKTVSIATFTAIALASATLAPSALAGDREWAVAGKVLTGVVAAGVIAHAFDSRPYVQPAPVYYQAPPVYYQAPPVYVASPAPVCAPAPVFVSGPPVVYYAAPAPVWVRPAPIVIYPGPAYVHYPVHHHGFRPLYCR